MCTRKYIMLICFGAILLSGCVSKTRVDGDALGSLLSGTTVMSVQDFKSLYRGYALTITNDIELQGVVIANDLFGSYPYMLVVADASGGIEIKISGEELYTVFPVGQEITVRCQGLALGDYGGVSQLGVQSKDPDYQTGWIPTSGLAAHFVKRDKIIVDVLPAIVTIRELLPKQVCTFIALEDVQFIDEELSLRWCEEETATTRHLIDRRGDTLEVRTVAGAMFANDMLPSGSGTVKGILSYFNRKYQLRVFSPKSVRMTEPRFVPAPGSNNS